MIIGLLFLLATLPHVGQQASPWESVTGVSTVEYRWSRPAANSCLVEFRNVNGATPMEFNMKTTYVTNRPQLPVKPTGPADKTKNPTVIKEQTEDHVQLVRLLKAGTATEGISGCYRIVVVKATAIPSKQPKQANDMEGTANASER
jgi:hypothetical protein